MARIHSALLLGALAALAVSPARAQEVVPTDCRTRTVKVSECVPETYQVKRIKYKIECRTEEVDAVKCVCVPEVRERTCTVVKRVPVMSTETRQVCVNVVEFQEKIVMKTCTKYVQETTMCKKLVALGRWECKEVCRPAVLDLFKCKDACNPCDACPKTRTKKVWVACPQYKECPVTTCKKVCVQVPTTCKVAVCRKVTKDVQVQKCTITCVQEQQVQKYTVMVQKQVPTKVTRTVRVCVPVEETVTCTRMVQRCREVTVQDDCAPRCRHSLFHGLRKGDCCR